MPLSQWDDVRLFLAAFRARSLTGAARALGVNQSTTSRRLGALEATLGVRLFDRVPGGLEPTAAARNVFPLAEAAEAQVLAFAGELAGADAELRGPVRLAVPEAIDSEVVVPGLPGLLERHPALEVELIASNSLANLARREADLAVRLVRPRGDSLVVRRATTLVTGVFGRGPHARLGVARAAWVTAPEGLTEPRELGWMTRHVSPEQVRFRTNRIEGRLAAAQAGLGLAILSTELARRRPELVRVPTPEPTPSYDVWLVAHPQLLRVPRVRAVWDFLLGLLAPPRPV